MESAADPPTPNEETVDHTMAFDGLTSGGTKQLSFHVAGNGVSQQSSCRHWETSSSNVQTQTPRAEPSVMEPPYQLHASGPAPPTPHTDSHLATTPFHSPFDRSIYFYPSQYPPRYHPQQPNMASTTAPVTLQFGQAPYVSAFSPSVSTVFVPMESMSAPSKPSQSFTAPYHPNPDKMPISTQYIADSIQPNMLSNIATHYYQQLNTERCPFNPSAAIFQPSVSVIPSTIPSFPPHPNMTIKYPEQVVMHHQADWIGQYPSNMTEHHQTDWRGQYPSNMAGQYQTDWTGQYPTHMRSQCTPTQSMIMPQASAVASSFNSGIHVKEPYALPSMIAKPDSHSHSTVNPYQRSGFTQSIQRVTAPQPHLIDVPLPPPMVEPTPHPLSNYPSQSYCLQTHEQPTSYSDITQLCGDKPSMLAPPGHFSNGGQCMSYPSQPNIPNSTVSSNTSQTRHYLATNNTDSETVQSSPPWTYFRTEDRPTGDFVHSNIAVSVAQEYMPTDSNQPTQGHIQSLTDEGVNPNPSSQHSIIQTNPSHPAIQHSSTVSGEVGQTLFDQTALTVPSVPLSQSVTCPSSESRSISGSMVDTSARQNETLFPRMFLSPRQGGSFSPPLSHLNRYRIRSLFNRSRSQSPADIGRRPPTPFFLDDDDDIYDYDSPSDEEDTYSLWSLHLRRPQSEDHNLGLDDDEALQVGIAASLNQEQTTRTGASTRRALENHLSTCLKCTAQCIHVSRADVWGCSLAFFKDVQVSDRDKQLMVKFNDFEGNREEAVDDGGPKREYLQLLLEAIVRDSGMLHGERDQGLLIRPNISHYVKEHFLTLGVMLATMIAQCGLPPAIFAPPVVDAILDEDTDLLKSLKYIPSSTIRESLQKVCDAANPDELDLALTECSWRFELDGVPTRVTMDNRDEFVSICVHYYVLLHSRPMLDQMTKGLKHCGILNLIRTHKLRHLLEYDPKAVLTAEKLMRLLTPKEELKKRESQILGNVQKFLTAVENGSLCDDLSQSIRLNETQASFIRSLTLAKFLTFITGCSQEPVGGFSPLPTIVFQRSSTWRLPRVSTCSNELFITVHEKAMTLPGLSMAMVTSLMNSQIFTMS